jgi:hypothetical protein
MNETYGTFSTAYVEAMRLRLSALEPENKGLAARVAEMEARCKRLEEALKECDRGFTKHRPDEWSTNGASWKAVREALGEPNPWEKSTP